MNQDTRQERRENNMKKVGSMVRITAGSCRGISGRVKEIYTLENETLIDLMDGYTDVVINSDYVEEV